MRATLFPLLLVFLALHPRATASTPSPELQAALNSLPADSTLSVLVEVGEPFPLQQLEENILRQGAGRQQRHERVVSELQEWSKSRQKPLVEWLEARRASGETLDWTPLWITNGLHLRAGRELLEDLARQPGVRHMELDRAIVNANPTRSDGGGAPWNRTLSQGLVAIHAPDVWRLGYSGEGRLVCNIDTGVDLNHSALNASWRGHHAPVAECFFDPVLGQEFPYDTRQHGTHTMGTMVGLSSLTGDTTGVAFGAQWIAAAVLDHPQGEGLAGTVALVLLSLQWACDPDGDPMTLDDVPDVINNSWGIPDAGLDVCDPFYWNALDACEAAGTVVIFSAGNSGIGGLQNPAARANTPYTSFSVGALDATDPENLQVADFSSRGPSPCTQDPVNAIKPEVAAPGVAIRSCIPGGGYSDEWNGTSMAAPHVSGIVALMRQVNPELDVITIKQILMETALDLAPAGEDNLSGHGLVNALACVQAAREGHGIVSGLVTGNGLPRTAWVELRDSDHRVVCDATGHYSISLPGSAHHDLRAGYFGFLPQDFAVEFLEDEHLVHDLDLLPAPHATFAGLVLTEEGEPIEGALVELVDTPLPPVLSDVDGGVELQLPIGYWFTARIQAQCLLERELSFFFSGDTLVQVTVERNPACEPTGPDAMGYRIFDSLDGPGSPVFEWESISGNGVRLFPDESRRHRVTLPFSYRFHGVLQQDLMIFHSGYVTPGAHGNDVSYNTCVPSGTEPNGSVYAMWDNLRLEDGGSLFYRHRPDRHDFVVQYDQIPTQSGTQTASFQLILRDPAFWPSEGGEAQWLVHYNSPVPSTCTIGIENPTGLQALQYACNGELDPHANPPGPGTSLLFLWGDGTPTVVEGRILRADDQRTIAGAEINAGAATIRSGSDGAYRLNVLSGELNLRVSARGYAPLDTLVVVPGETPLDLSLQPVSPATLQGSVRGPGGDALAGATIRIQGSLDSMLITDRSGRYILDAWAGETLSIEASAPGIGSLSHTLTLEHDDRFDFQLTQNPAWLPSGPDAWGYRIFDGNDLGGPTRRWSSIAGQGTRLTLEADGCARLAVPFACSFYGIPFDSLTVSEHGYLTPGRGMSSAINGPIPGSQRPNGSIFAHWRRLRFDQAGALWAEYSPAHGGLVIEFDQVAVTSQTVSFQIILLDPELSGNLGSDSDFLVQYKDPGSLSFTVGIEDPDGATGVQYQHAYVLAESASPIQAGSCLLFTTDSRGLLECDDAQPPRITIEPQGDLLPGDSPPPLSVAVDGACGQLHVELETRLNQLPWSRVTMEHMGLTAYEAPLPQNLEAGDRVDYRVLARGLEEGSTPAVSPEYHFFSLPWQILYQESFDGQDLGDCELLHGDTEPNTWAAVWQGPVQGWAARVSGLNEGAGGALRTPRVDAGQSRHPALKFWQTLVVDGGVSTATRATVSLSTDGGETYDHELLVWDKPEGVQTDPLQRIGSQWIELPAIAAECDDVRIEFRFQNDAWSSWTVDEIHLCDLIPLSPRLEVRHESAGQVLLLSWQAVNQAVAYTVEFGQTPTGPWSRICDTHDLSLPVSVQGSSGFYRVRALLDRDTPTVLEDLRPPR